MRKLPLLIGFVLLAISIHGQNTFKPDEKYKQRSAAALTLYEKNEYLQSALSYDTLFDINKGEGFISDWYNAACSWALAGGIDKAFFYLDKAVVEGKWTNLSHILSDSDLDILHPDKRWQALIDIVKMNKEKAEANFNKPLVALLDTIYEEDQADRRNVDPIQKKYGWQSKEMDSLFQKITYLDSINLLRVKNIIDTYGWLGADVVGAKGAKTIFLVIQHADSLTQVTYVPKLREAVKKGKAEPQDLALLEDRILTTQGKKQIYGSQVRTNPETGKYAFFPIMDEANVNKRRALVGLGPLEEYAKFFDIEYKLPSEKKN